VSILGSEHDLPGDVEWLTQASCTLPTWTDQGAGNMADTYLQGSFAFRCTTAEADLLVEALRALHHIMMEDEPELPSPAMMEIFPPSRADAPWSGLIDVMPDPDFRRSMPIFHGTMCLICPVWRPSSCPAWRIFSRWRLPS
jgi:hypothetical protein